MALFANTSVPTGKYALVISATGAGVTKTVALSLTVTPPPSFTISGTPVSFKIAPGATVTSRITSTAAYGFTSLVALSCGSLPAGISVRLAATSISGNGGFTTLTVIADSSVSVGTHRFTVSGTGGGKTPAPITVTLSVGTFSVSSSASALTVTRGSSATITLNTSTTGAFTGPLTFSATGIPKGVGVTFSPATITNPAAGVTTVRFTALSTAVTGTQNVTLTATNSGAVRDVTITLKVQ